MSDKAHSLSKQSKPASFTPAASGVLQRQCACGNHTVAGGECSECAKKKNMLQRKLSIGVSNDPLEQEADRVANQVMATPTHPAVSGAPLHIQRFTGQITGESCTAPASVDRVLAGPGRPLAPALRQDMQQRFGYDFSQVRVHSGAMAEQSARDVNAHAYTIGNNIVFGAGQFTPGSPGGRRLIAHELTHVVQQQTNGNESLQRDIDQPALEQCIAELGGGTGYRDGGVATPDELDQYKKECLARQAPTQSSIDSLPLGKEIGRLPNIPTDQALRALKRYQQFLIIKIAEGEGRIRSLRTQRAESFDNYLIGGAIEVFGGTSLPSDDWVEPWQYVNAAYDTLRKQQINESLDYLNSAKHATIRKWREFSTYLEQTDKGAEHSIASLEAIRDVSFVVVGAVGTVVTGGVLGGAIIGTAATTVGQVAEQGTSVAIGIKKEIDWSGIAFDTVLGFALSLLGGKIAQRLAGGTASSELVRAVSRNPPVAQFLKSIGGNLAETTWKQLVQRALTNVLYGRAQSIVQGAAKLLFNRLRGERPKLTGEDFVALLVDQLTNPRAYFMDILGGEIGVLAHGYLQGAGATVEPTTQIPSKKTSAGSQATTRSSYLWSRTKSYAAAAMIGVSEAVPAVKGTGAGLGGESPQIGSQVIVDRPSAQPHEGATPALKFVAEPQLKLSQTAESLPVKQAAPSVSETPVAKTIEPVPAKSVATVEVPAPPSSAVVEPPPKTAQSAESTPTIKSKPLGSTEAIEDFKQITEKDFHDMIDQVFKDPLNPSYKIEPTDTGDKTIQSKSDRNRHLDIEGPKNTSGKPIHSGQVLTAEQARQASKVLGKTIHSPEAGPAVKSAWDKARAEVEAKHGPLTENNYSDLYDKARNKFWDNVKADPGAEKFFTDAGFVFTGVRAPVLGAAVNQGVRTTQFRVSLDHLEPKATGKNWQHALDGDKLMFITQADNTKLQHIESTKPSLKRGLEPEGGE